MSNVFDTVVQYLTENDWKFTTLDGEPALLMGFKGKSGSWQCFISVDEAREWFSFFSILPATVPEPKRLAVAEFLTRANYGLPMGNFEMDFTDGEVRFKTSVDVEGSELTDKMIENLIFANLTT